MSAREFLLPVLERRQITPTVFHLVLERPQDFHFRPGQFASFVIPGAGPKGRDLRRAYSIASAPEAPHLEFCIKKVEGGPGSTYLSDRKVGDTLKTVAPYGEFVFRHPLLSVAPHVLLISTGTGISPFRSLVQSKLLREHPPQSLSFLFGAQNEGELLYPEELKDLRVALSRPTEGWNGFRGRVTDLLRAKFNDQDWGRTQIYLCGNGAMIDEVKRMAMEWGTPKNQIFQEVYYKGA